MDCDLGASVRVNAQYSKKECLEAVGLPYQVDDNQFETKVLQIFEKVGLVFLILDLLMTSIVLVRIMTES